MSALAVNRAVLPSANHFRSTPQSTDIARPVKRSSPAQRYTVPNKKDQRSSVVPKLSSLYLTLSCQLAADRLAAAAGVDARFALAAWTLAFGPFAVETSVPSDACHP
jgi:hypothetical protein